MIADIAWAASRKLKDGEVVDLREGGSGAGLIDMRGLRREQGAEHRGDFPLRSARLARGRVCHHILTTRYQSVRSMIRPGRLRLPPGARHGAGCDPHTRSLADQGAARPSNEAERSIGLLGRVLASIAFNGWGKQALNHTVSTVPGSACMHTRVCGALLYLASYIFHCEDAR